MGGELTKQNLKKAIAALTAQPGTVIPTNNPQAMSNQIQYLNGQWNTSISGLTGLAGSIGGGMALSNASQCPTCGGWYTGVHMCPVQSQLGNYYVYGNGIMPTVGPPVTATVSPYPFGNISRSPVAPIGIDKAKFDALKKVEPRKVLDRVPDYTEPITAYRCWDIDTDGKLRSLGTTAGFWRVKEKLASTCVTKGCAKSPNRECDCGYWAFKELDTLVAAAANYNPKVIGLVYLWGRIIETENGYRAEYAYPKELWSLNADDVIEELGRSYGVPIRTANVVTQEERGTTK